MHKFNILGKLDDSYYANTKRRWLSLPQHAQNGIQQRRSLAAKMN